MKTKTLTMAAVLLLSMSAAYASPAKPAEPAAPSFEARCCGHRGGGDGRGWCGEDRDKDAWHGRGYCWSGDEGSR